MTRRLALVSVLVLMMGAAPEGDLTYTPPPSPEPPSIGSVLLRLGGATATALALCGGTLWLLRRGLGRSGAGPKGNRLRLLSTLQLGGGSFLFLLQFGQRKYVAGVGRQGVLQTLTPLSTDFEETFDELTGAAGNAAPSTPPSPLPASFPPITG
jgi:flagellar biogenesis protein FliO